jgi:hypothetical protein
MMSNVVKKASPAAIAVLQQATALVPKRKKTSDGILPSKAHQKLNPNSDHNLGLAVDLTHDPASGFDCHQLFDKLRDDDRVLYLIFHGKIWVRGKGESRYTGINPHVKHIHISIVKNKSTDTSPWFPWMGKPKVINKVKAKLAKKPKKESNT